MALLTCFTWIVAVAGIALVGGAIDTTLDSLTFLAPALLALNTLDLLACLRPDISKRRLLLTVTVVAECVLVALVLPEANLLVRRTAAQAVGTEGGAHVKVLSLNLWYLNDDLTETFALIDKEQPDVVVFAEAGETVLGQINQRLDAYPTRITCAASAYCGVAIYSRLHGRLIAGGAWMADGLLGDREAPSILRHAAVELELPDTPGLWFPLVAVHVTRGGTISPAARQIPALFQSIQAIPDASRLIVAGDFNTATWSWAMQRLDAGIGLHRTTLNMQTWPTGSAHESARFLPPVLAIDHVYADAAWSVIDVWRGPDVGSDHYPVLVTLGLAPIAPPAG